MSGGEMAAGCTDSSRPGSRGQPVEFRLPARLESLAVVRALMTAVGTLEDLDLDVVADLRLALDEACTALIRSAVPDATLVVDVQPRPRELCISVSAPCVATDVLRPGTFSWHVISSLTHDAQTFHDGAEVDEKGRIFGVRMLARRPDR
jgi:anti-sigma regulatory factor (Ser/Thr protein kinase)